MGLGVVEVGFSMFWILGILDRHLGVWDASIHKDADTWHDGFVGVLERGDLSSSVESENIRLWPWLVIFWNSVMG